MTYLAPRSCTKIDENNKRLSQPLAYFRNSHAYVLLGEPGMGKTVAFQEEAKQKDSYYVTARDLLTFRNKPEWKNKTLFIDGLDEVRAGSDDPRGPFDAIRKCLADLGRPKFRLSCREADWLGSSDREQLRQVTPDQKAVEELHLNVLTEGDIEKILEINYGDEVEDSSAFLVEANRQGFNELIRNPQILDMLVHAVSGEGRWPSSRRETFEFACRNILLKEHNEEHSIASKYAADEILEAAGYLLTLILLADLQGVSLVESSAAPHRPSLTEIGFKDIQLLRTVVRSKLFRSEGGCRTYVHRTIAEYLAACHLRRRIEDYGLPLGRTLALMTGRDGIAVTALRGLYAWLATLCDSQREILLARDPLGIVLYGDVKHFSTAEKRKILECFKDEANRYASSQERYFGALCTQDMEPSFREYLLSADRTEEHQVLLGRVLSAMQHGERLPGLSDCLFRMIRDPGWFPLIRAQVLYAYISLVRDEKDKAERLKGILMNIHAGKPLDGDDNLLGILLRELYPDTVTPAEIFDYLRPSFRAYFSSSYEHFWSHYLGKLTREQHIPVLLDELVSRKEQHEPLNSEIPYQMMISELLLSGLRCHGDTIPVEKLSEWLGLGLDRDGHRLLDIMNHLREIRDWLGSHPDKQKAIIDSWIERCENEPNFDRCMWKLQERFYLAPLPEDYGLWCLQKAISSGVEAISRYFTTEAVRALIIEKYHTGLSLELLERAAIDQPRMTPWIQGMLFSPIDEDRQTHIRKTSEITKQRRGEKEKYIQFIKKNIEAIQAGTADPGILYGLGRAYYGRYFDSQGENAHKRLANHIEDADIARKVLSGFVNCLKRDDIPEAAEVFQLRFTQNKVYSLSLPVMAGFEEIGDNSLELPENLLRTALGFYFCDMFDSEPNWVQALVRECPKLVSEILVEYARGALRNREEHIRSVYAIAFDEKYREVARHASLPILKAFPTRCTVRQLECLAQLLNSALHHADPDRFGELIERKLRAKSMNTGQYVYWLGVAFVMLPEKYERAVDEYFKAKEGRVSILAGLLTYRSDQLSLLNNLGESALALLIRMIGEFYAPYSIKEGAVNVTAGMEKADLVQEMINKLATFPKILATEELQALLNLTRLSRWQNSIRHALYQQLMNRREAEFRHPTSSQVTATLQNLAPANVADLAALVSDSLRDIAYRIRDGDTDDYKQYWNVDSHNKAFEPRHEEACRNALLSDLKSRLGRLGIDAVAEFHYADGKRSDIRVSYGGAQGYNVPIEIKCSHHKRLWYAIHDQLIDKYTRDPGAHGYGIYLVLWFGRDRTMIPPHGDMPKTANELENRLRQSLKSDLEKRLISVCVIDVKAP